MPLVTRKLGNATVEFKAADPALLARLAVERTLLHDLTEDLVLGSLTLHADLPQLALGAGDRQIAIEASGGASALLGAWDSPAEAVAALGVDDALEPFGVALPKGRYVALATAYDASGSAKGQMALGSMPGSISVGAGASSSGTFAVVRQMTDPGTTVIGAFEALIDSVQLPREVRSSADLAPDTWIVTEVEGAVRGNVGAELGYSFNWVRESPTRAIVGDLGLKVRLSAAFAYAVQAQSRFVIVLGHGARPGQVRLRILRRRQTSKAGDLSLGVGAQATIPLPASPADFLATVFGLRTEQLLKDVKRWLAIASDPAQAADEVLRIARPQLDDLLNRIEPARERLAQAMAAWDRLDRIAADAVAQAIDVIGTPAVVDLKAFLQLVSEVQDGSQLAALLRKELDERRFRGSAQERWLWAVLERGPLDALVDTSVWTQAQQAAQATLDVLDGTTAAELVVKLQALAEDRLNLDLVRTAAAPGALDRWLQGKLELLLGRAIDAAGLVEIRDALTNLEARGNELYTRIVDAANDEYALTLKAALTSERVREAVIDLEFDTATQSGREALAAALGGDFADLLVTPSADVIVHAGLLTDSIDRRRSISVAMPFFRFDEQSITKASARLKATREGAEVYMLDASNEVRTRTRTSSALAVHAAIPVRGVDVHGRTGGLGYTFRQFTPDAMTDLVALQLETYARAYFPRSFSEDGDFDQTRFTEWVSVMERAVNDRATRWSSPALFGTTVIGLDIRMPREAVLAWTKAPAKKKDAKYYELSLALQRALKRWMFFYYFQGLERFRSDPAEALLVFTAMPDFHRGVRTGLSSFELRTGEGELFWQFEDLALVDFLIESRQTAKVLSRRLRDIRAALTAVGVTDQKRFTLEAVTRTIRARNTPQRARLDGLLKMTSRIVNTAAEAGRHMRDALDATRPDEVLKSLREFGEDVTETFNRDLGAFTHDQTNFRPLASLVYLEAARVFDPALDDRIVAQLSVAALRENATFTKENLMNGQLPAADQVIFDERLVRS